MVPRCGASMGGAGFWAPLLVLLQLAAAAAGPPKTIMTILIGARSVSLPALPFADCQCHPEPDSATDCATDARDVPPDARRPGLRGHADEQPVQPHAAHRGAGLLGRQAAAVPRLHVLQSHQTEHPQRPLPDTPGHRAGAGLLQFPASADDAPTGQAQAGGIHRPFYRQGPLGLPNHRPVRRDPLRCCSAPRLQ
jgi:hypothetical protein